MKNFYSLSKFPGKTGEGFYNGMFAKFKLPYVYTALPCENLSQEVNNLVAQGAAGISVSMPFKSAVIPLLDYKDSNVKRFNSCNTILITDGKLMGYNTDIEGVQFTLREIPTTSQCSILGDGAMGSMYKKMLGYKSIVYSRKLENWDSRHTPSDVIINCTSFGTATKDSPFVILPKCSLVIDLAIKPNHLEKQCAEAGVKYIGGLDFYRHQFIAQFKIYTGICLTLKDFKDD